MKTTKKAVIICLNINRSSYDIIYFLKLNRLNISYNFALQFESYAVYGCNRLRDGSQRAIAESMPPPSPAPPCPPLGNMLSVSLHLKRIFASSPTTTVL